MNRVRNRHGFFDDDIALEVLKIGTVVHRYFFAVFDFQFLDFCFIDDDDVFGRRSELFFVGFDEAGNLVAYGRVVVDQRRVVLIALSEILIRMRIYLDLKVFKRGQTAGFVAVERYFCYRIEISDEIFAVIGGVHCLRRTVGLRVVKRGYETFFPEIAF